MLLLSSPLAALRHRLYRCQGCFLRVSLGFRAVREKGEGSRKRYLLLERAQCLDLALHSDMDEHIRTIEKARTTSSSLVF